MNPTPLKRALLTGAALTLAAAPLAGCSSDDETSDGSGTTVAAESAETSQAAVTVSDVWSRPASAGGNASVYMTLTGGETDDALVGLEVSRDVAESATLHETVRADDGDNHDDHSNSGEMDSGEMDSGDMDSGEMDSDHTEGAAGGEGEIALGGHESAHGDDSHGDTDEAHPDGDSDHTPSEDGDHGGMMEMQEVESIPVPAGETVNLEPGGYHVMLADLVEDLAVGDTVQLTLGFDNGESQIVTADVKEA